MSSIRPLVTITILVIVGVFLYTKINEGPSPLGPRSNDAVQSAPPTGIPPLAIEGTSQAPGGPATLAPAASDAAPQWAGSVADNAPANTPTSLPVAVPIAEPNGKLNNPTNVDSAATSLPAVPTIPELPPLPSTDAAASTAPPANPPIGLPANNPGDRYSAASASPQTAAPPLAATSPPAAIPSTAPNGSTSAESSSQSSFSIAWPVIQAALARQELAQAHLMLSEWYGNPALTPSESQQVESLLSQLAGTVVYSTQHRLEPPYVVHQGDTLQTIAQQYEVPWQLLAKINGIPAADMVQPGQELKVIHGPFNAIVELGKGQMTLMLDGRYAGRFTVAAEPGAATTEGKWIVEQKLANPTTAPVGVIGAAYTAAPPAADYVLVLRNDSPAAGGATISITSGPSSPSGPTAVAPAAVRLSPADAEEVADILSVGSHVTIRR